MDCEKCYKFLQCWGCEEWLGCKADKRMQERKSCFRCNNAGFENNAVDECESCKIPGVE